MSYRRRTIRLLLCVTLVAVPAVSFVAFLFTPFAVYTFGVELRPPWQDKAAWHLSRMDWFVQEAGYEHIVREHRAALIAMTLHAVPTLIEEAASGDDRHKRERAVLILRDIGLESRPTVLAAAIDAEGDRRGRLLYAAFVAFKDRHAFAQWLDYAAGRGPFALQDNCMEYHIQDFWDAQMPDYAVPSGDDYAINPEFVEWWETNGGRVPFVRRPE